jgi:pantoate--beta-alanine ligase
VLLCVPDAEIAAAAAAIAPGRLVGHCSGATGLDVLSPHEAFSLHPLMTVPAGAPRDVLESAGCAVDGSTPRALELSRALAARLGMRATQVTDRDRAAYHAAASIASNFLVTLEGAAERLAATAGVERALLAPLVRAAVENWAARGAEEALTGPIARGDDETVVRQRDAGGGGDMRIIRTNAEMRAHRWRARGTVGLVPTMGAFHGGHHALMRAARERCDEVVVSLFVNPAQFNEPADLDAYPRDEARDAAEAAELGIDVLYTPPVEDVYPPGFATSVRVEGLSDVLEGAQRGPGHFAGVCTVVSKLFNVVTPDVAYFGQKDAQQVAVLRRMVKDLDLPVELAIIPTVREADGLAMSSRNQRLTPDERTRALALSRALNTAEAEIAAGERDAETIAAGARAAMDGVQPEYLALVDPDSFQPVVTVAGRVLIVVAARIGATRLIDNTIVQPAATRERAPTT